LKQDMKPYEIIKKTNIEVCIRVRPISIRGNTSKVSTNNDKSLVMRMTKPQISNTKSYNRRSKRVLQKKIFNGRKLSSRGNAPEKNIKKKDDNILAWNVVGADTIQQSEETDRIKGRTKAYTLDRVYGTQSTTLDLYNQSVRPVVMSTLHGYHASVFAYGQTSTGKTYTMAGTTNFPGIVPLALKDIFLYIERGNEISREYLIRVSYLEIYNEQVVDLLSETTSPIRILETKGEVLVKGLREEVVTSPDQIFRLLKKGDLRRQVGATNMNKHSSRSHAIVRIFLESKASNPDDVCNGDKLTRVSSLSLVDLAGSESVRLTGSTGERRREGQYINKSLMTLGKVIYKLCELQQQNTENTGGSHIPYRDSKLTRLLQPSLSGNAQMVCICTISPSCSHLEESHNTLKFAIRAKKVQQRVMLNEVQDQNTLLQEYKNEIDDLRQQLAEAKSAKSMQQFPEKEEESQELILAIQKMEALILTASKLKKGRSGEEIQTSELGALLPMYDPTTQSDPNKRFHSNANSADEVIIDNITAQPLYQEMHRIQALLSNVLSRRGLTISKKCELENEIYARREEEVEELRNQLHQQEVATSLKNADATFLQSQLRQKDNLLLEVSKVLEAVEARQLELETENAKLKKAINDKDQQLAMKDRRIADNENELVTLNNIKV